MADNDNTFLTADNLYEDVEGEAGDGPEPFEKHQGA